MLFPDDQFHPEKSITQNDLLISLLKAEKKLNKISQSENWPSNLIEFAKKERLINKNIKKNSGSLSWSNLITHIQFHPRLKNLKNEFVSSWNSSV